MTPHARGGGRSRIAAIGAVLVLMIAGIVVTATASPGPPTDVKTAQYGTPTPPATSGPCKGIGGEAGAGCQANYKLYKKAIKACKKKKTLKARKACTKKVNKLPQYALFVKKH